MFPCLSTTRISSGVNRQNFAWDMSVGVIRNSSSFTLTVMFPPAALVRYRSNIILATSHKSIRSSRNIINCLPPIRSISKAGWNGRPSCMGRRIRFPSSGPGASLASFRINARKPVQPIVLPFSKRLVMPAIAG